MKRMLSIALLCCVLPLWVMGNALDDKITKVLVAEGQKLGEQYHLTLLNTGYGTIARAKEGAWAIHWTCDRSMTIDQARPMAQAMAQRMQKMMQADPLFKKYCAERNKYSSSPFELTSDKLAFRLAYWDANVDRPLHPYLAEVRLADNFIYYHYADPKTQALLDPICEPLQL